MVLVVNPVASSVTAATIEEVADRLAANHDLTVEPTGGRGDAAELARAAAAEGIDVVVILGGDGTFNEAANGLAGTVGTATALAGLPGGSTNVFARTLGYPNDPVASVPVLLAALERGDVRPVGLGQVNDRYFLLHCGIGFDAAVVERVERRSHLKRWAAHALFAWSAAVTWAHSRRDASFRLRLPGGEELASAYAVVLNTDPYTYLGRRPFRVAPDADLDHPLALVALRDLHLRTVVAVGVKALGPGLAGRPPRGAVYRPGLGSLELEADRPVLHQVDGEHLGPVDRLSFRWRPDAVRLVVPDPTGITTARRPRG